MSYLDLLTDDIMIKILDSRCDDIEKEIKKLENDINDIENLFDIYYPDADGGKIYLRFDNLVLDKKINANEIFKPFHIGKARIVHNLDNNNRVVHTLSSAHTVVSNIIINPNFFIYMNTAYKHSIKYGYTTVDNILDKYYEVELPRFICVKDDITYFFQKITDEDEEEDFNTQLEILRNDYAVADPYNEDEINQYYQDEIYLNNLSSNI